MSIFKEYNYLAASTNNITSLTSYAAAANSSISFNGVLGDTKIAFNNKYTFVPRITFTSGADRSNITFTLRGYQNGIYIEELLVGPNAATVTSVNAFDILEAITYTTNGGVPPVPGTNFVSVGTSGVGYFPMIRLNTLKQNVTNLNYALNMMVAAANPATYQVFLSLKDSYNQGTYDSLTTANNNFIAPAVASNVSALLQYTQLASNILIKITPNANGTALKAQFMQI